MRTIHLALLAAFGLAFLAACSQPPAYQDVSDPSDGSNSKTKLHRSVDR
jgi:uncharacterized lipoprotein YajG